jgi:CDP-diacylglycerol--serine O-phosphatidyltransferase
MVPVPSLKSDRPLPPRRFRAVPIRIILPNLVTILALCLGLSAIRLASDGQFDKAVLSILAAAVLDGIDGRLARALKGTTRFGAELDSLADFLDFGVAPALTLYFWSLSSVKSFGWFAAMVFAIACALRLARFNVAIDDENKPAWASQFFTGMPAPAGAIVVLMPLYLHLSALELTIPRGFVPLEIIYVLVIAALMASRIPHWSGKGIGRVPREQVVFVLFGVAIIILLLATFPMEMLIVLTLAYLIHIPFSVQRLRRLQRGALAAETATDGETASE